MYLTIDIVNETFILQRFWNILIIWYVCFCTSFALHLFVEMT